MSLIKKCLFSALLAPLLGGPAIHAAELEVLDRFSVNGYAVLRGSADISGSGFTVGGSTFVVKNGNVGIGTSSPAANLDVSGTGSIKIPVGTTGERPAAPVAGMLRLNLTTGKLEYYNSGKWNTIGGATGGTITESGGYRIHTFTVNGTFTASSDGNVEYLVVAGGGGGGQGYQAGGGGAGGYRTGTLAITAGTAIAVTVGAGGAGGPSSSGLTSNKGSNGADSVFATITAAGGGGGASYWNGDVGSNSRGLDGGSGGGAGNTSAGADAGGSGIAGQGYAGGSAPGYASPYCGGGGGGAGGAGANGGGAGAYGTGGAGVTSSISGASVGYAGGGGGGTYDSGLTTATHGGGAGGRGDTVTLPVAGTVNTGGGGGGAGSNSTAGAAGGSGIVIIRYPI